MTELTREQRLDRRARTKAFLADPENIDDLIEYLSDGDHHLRGFCRANDFVYAAIQAALSEDKEIAPRYRAAKLIRAEILMSEIEDLEAKLATPLAKDEARAIEFAIKSKQWRITKLNPADYSDRSRVDNVNWDATKMHLIALRGLSALPRSEQLPVLPSTPVPRPSIVDASQAVDAEFSERKE